MIQMVKKVFQILVLLAFCITVTACGRSNRASITLPKSSDINRVSISSGDAVKTSVDNEYIEKLIAEMQTAKDTGKKSISDEPRADDYVKISFSFVTGGESVVYMYFKNNKLLLEQPYTGIYSADSSLAETIDEIV